jgi:hypothetical protein
MMSLVVKRRGRPTKEMVEERERLAIARLKPKLSDAEVLADISSRFDMMAKLTVACTKGDIPAMVVPGAPGVGKSYTVTRALDAAECKYVRVTGGISAVELYALAYHHRAKGNVVVLDDSDSILRDEQGINIIKALTDSSTRRTISWRKQNKSLESEEIPDVYVFQGSIIFISNLDFQAIVDDGKSAAAVHIAALMSRSLYLETGVHDRRSLDLWIRHIATAGRMIEVEGLKAEQGAEILDWMRQEREHLREYSLRTLHHLCTLVKIDSDWKAAAKLTLCR